LIQDENHNSELREDDTSELKSTLGSLPKDMPFAPSEELSIQDIVIKNEDFKENNRYKI